MARNQSEQRIVASANGEGFRPYDRYGTPIKGLSWLPLRFDAETGMGSFLIRFEPGAASLPHEHGGVEVISRAHDGAVIAIKPALFEVGENLEQSMSEEFFLRPAHLLCKPGITETNLKVLIGQKNTVRGKLVHPLLKGCTQVRVHGMRVGYG